MPPRVAIRVDASVALGSGHVMRCLTLATALRCAGCDVLFLCRAGAGDCCGLIEERGFSVARLPEGPLFDAVEDAARTVFLIEQGCDWLIVDHYGIGATWERTVRARAQRIMVIDDLADRPHDCELLLDQNLFAAMEERYRRKVPGDCRLFLGPGYALLREEFLTARASLRARDGAVGRVLLFFGGSDPTSETQKALEALQLLGDPPFAVDVVVGGGNPDAESIRGLCAGMPQVTFHRQVSNMAQLMAAADLAVGAGGTATWERCYLGLPALVVVVAENQAEPARAAHDAGLVTLLGESSEVSAASLAAAIEAALRNPEALAESSRRCLAFLARRDATVHEEIVSALLGAVNG